MNKQLVSVIIPNFNHAQYLEQRLNSVFNQTYLNFEVIILDDKSTDNSLDVINRYKDNPHLSQIVVNETNSGSTFKQWERGFNMAKGEWIWIAESDDYCTNDFLEQLMNECLKHKDVVVAHSNYIMCDEENNIISQSKEWENRYYNGKRFVRRRMARFCDIHNASGAIFKRSVLPFVSNAYQTYQSTGDYQFWSEVAACGNVVKVNKNLAFWRQSVKSVTGTKLSKGITAKEDRRVYEYINSKHHLNSIEKYIAYASHISRYRIANLDNEQIREDILNQWQDGYSHGRFDKYVLWLIGSLERHFGILI